MSLKTGSRWSNWAWDKPVKAFIWRSSRICRPIGGLPPWFFEESLPHFLLRNNSNEQLFGLAIEEGGAVQVMSLHAIVDRLESVHVQFCQQVVQAIAKAPELGDPFKLRRLLGGHTDVPPA